MGGKLNYLHSRMDPFYRIFGNMLQPKYIMQKGTRPCQESDLQGKNNDTICQLGTDRVLDKHFLAQYSVYCLVRYVPFKSGKKIGVHSIWILISASKGQLISKCLFGVIISTKIQTKLRISAIVSEKRPNQKKFFIK